MKSPALLALLLASAALAADPRGDNPDAKPSTPQEQLKMFHLPPGFEIQLVAAEPEIQKPLNITFDAAGRLWVTGSEMYPWPAGTDAQSKPIPNFAKAYDDIAGAFGARGKAPAPSDRARDTVRVLSDFDETGRARKITIFADGLNIPSGVQPLPRGSAAIAKVFPDAYLPDPNPAEPKPAPIGQGHLRDAPKGDSAIIYSIPNIYLMTDWDGDGRADKREVLYGTAGFLDTHGGMSSFLYWIDGWIYGTHGFRNHSEIRDKSGRLTVLDSGNTYRFRPDGSAFEIYTHGQTNPFGLTVDPLGNFYSADSHSKPVYMLLRGAYYEGIGKQHDGLGFAPRITDDDHGSTSIAGIAYYAAEQFPEEYRGNLFNGNPVTRRINRAKLEWRGSTPRAIRQPDFLTCDDPWFRPVQVKLGPDGALYIADFYNCIIGHYEFPLADPRRDRTHGRIWRIVWRGESARTTGGEAPSQGAAAAPGSAGLRPAGDGILPSRTSQTSTPGSDAAPQEVRRDGTPRPALQRSALPGPMPDLTALDAAGLVKKLADPNLIVRTLATNELAVRFGKNDAPALTQSAAASLLDQTPGAERLASLLTTWMQTPANDTEMIHAARMAMRDCLIASGGYAEGARLAAHDAGAAEKIADVSLGAKSPEAAEFLLGHLERTRFSTARAGEYVRHAALQIAPERLPALAALLTTEGSAPARPTSTGGKSPTRPAPPEDQGRAGAHPSELTLAQRLALADGLAQAVRQRGSKLPDEAAAWIQRTMVDALATTDEAMLKRAIESVRETKLDAKLDPLAKIAADTKRTGPIRAAALEALANATGSGGVLAAALSDTSSMTLRKRAAELLSQTGGKDAAATLLATLPTAPGELATTIAAGLAKKDDTAALLLAAIEQGKAAPTLLRDKLAATALEKRAQRLRYRAAALTKDLPAEDARLDKLIAERVAAFRAAQPDAARGAQVYAQQCAVCHRLQSAGGNIGPALDGVGARGLHRIAEDILDPNRNVDPIFRQTVIETDDGQTLAGLNAREEGELLTLTDATGKAVSVAKAKVKSQTQSKLSLMPAAFEQTISTNDFNDLLAHLLGTAPR